MATNKNNIKQLIQNIFTSGMDEKYDIELKRKTKLINIICIIGIINLIPLGTLSVIQDSTTLGFFDLVVGFVLISIVLYLRKTGYHIFYSYFGISIAGILFIYLFATGGFENTGHLWYYTFPLFTSFLLGSKRGAIATSILFAFAMLFFMIENYSSIIMTYPTDFKVRFTTSFLVVSTLSFVFEKTREKIQQQLAEKNIELGETITELKQAEGALRESETLLKATLEATANGILVVNEVGRVVSRNARFGEMWRIPKDVLETNDDEKLLNCVLEQLKDPQAFLSKVQELYKTSKTDFDILYFKDGRVFERYSEPLIVEDRIAGRVWSLMDITERKQTEKERAKLQAKLQRSQQMEAIGTLAGGVAHDLNNILSGIVSYPDLLLMQIPEDSPFRKHVLIMQDSGKKAAHIVQDLLTLARRGVAVKEVLNLNDIISEYLKSPEYEKMKSYHPGFEVETTLEVDLFNISGSPVHLSKTIMNLFSNAAEAMTDGGKVFISTKNSYLDRPIGGYDRIEEGEYVVLEVSDTGIGISSCDIDRIFEPFYTKKIMGRSGTGLGMAVVWGTVKDHKGYIDVQSTEGKGTTFTLYFPITRQEVDKEKALLPIENYMGKGESILVVDDIKEQREIAVTMLNTLGYAAEAVSSGEDAVEYLNEHTVNLIQLDMIMDPGIDGLETYKKILEVHPGQKAIIASGFSETDCVKEAQSLGAGQYIKKPYTLEKIGLAAKTELGK